MSQTGSLIVRTYVSQAQLPVPNATVIIYSIMQNDQKNLIAIRATNESGIAGPIELTAGDSKGLTPDSPIPFTDYQLLVEHPDYQLAIFRDLQIFPGVQTLQDVALIPLSVPEGVDSNTTTVTPQTL